MDSNLQITFFQPNKSYWHLGFIINIVKKNWIIIATLLLSLVFIFFRLYKIQDSLLFFNDMGRDFQVLLDWKESGKPPLLGPQTSAVSFNQSAIYFYFLYPLFLITNSAFSSIYTLIIFYLIAFLLGAYLYRSNKKTLLILFASFFLISIQPEMIRQNRFIWNPSFVPLFLLIALFSFKELITKFSNKKLIIFCLSAAFAAALNFSVIPSIFILLIFLIFKLKTKTKILKLINFFILSNFLTNLPTVAFEIRHKFALTNLLIHGQTLKQAATSFTHKYSELINYLFKLDNIYLNSAILFLIFLFLILNIKKSKNLLFFSLILLANFLLTLLLPFNIESHYIFGFLSVLIFTISLLPKKYLLILSLILSFIWLKPKIIKQHFAPARRTVKQMQNCYKNFCQDIKEPIYVSMESGILPYHNAPEHRFFMRQAGCNVLNIEETQDQANLMAVVADDATYEHNKTAYNELTLFGKSEQISKQTCQKNLKIYLLQKSTAYLKLSPKATLQPIKH
jgi:hypothetical protein